MTITGRLSFPSLKCPEPSPHLGYRWRGELAGQDVMRMRVFFIVGYDPQKLLPSPERLERERLEWWDRLQALFASMPIANEMIDFETGSGIPLPMPRYDVRPDRVAVIAGADYSSIELRLLAAHADPRVRSIVLDIETLDRFYAVEPNHQLQMYALGMMIADKPKVAKKAPPSYLKHDPTKQHRRGRRK